ncbi:O-methyltransferase [Quillaja saponaria]|uniref:isoflavone 7-O-methyltransferase n=1 Tax=Quillaja saponaria TaxID=32244 RepID=A0AAD7PUP6_QUISA|nr:O-methyltransferase [Quillaja saponaria]
MDLNQGQGGSELFQAQSHLYKHIFNFIGSMSLRSAVQLGIPDIIYSHGQPVTLPELVLALKIDQEKSSCVYRLMRLLVHSGIFANTKIHKGEKEEEGYDLTPLSRLLLKDNVTSLSPFVLAMLSPAISNPWQFLGDWFHRNELTPFEVTFGMGFWDYGSKNQEFGRLFNEAMVSDSGMMNLVIKDCKSVFLGLNSVVDVGGGKGAAAKIISEAFPDLKCMVLDLPHVVENLPESNNLNFVGGDMFQSIPPADAILLKLVLHAFGDEDCVKVLKKCREAIIASKDRGGKVIVIDIVINEKKDEHELTEAKLFFDMLMMVVVTGRERNEKEWEKLFLEAGFSHYTITPIFGLRAISHFNHSLT